MTTLGLGPETRPDSRSNSIALGILTIGIVLRLYGSAGFPFDQDELYTVVESTRLLDSPLRPGIEGRPLYYLLQHPLLAVLPHTAFWIRLPALISGILGVWVTWLLGRRVAGPVVGASAMLFVAVSPWHIYASGMARYWSLVYLASAGFWLLYERARSDERVLSYLWAFVPLAVGTLSHPTFVFPLPFALVAAHAISSSGDFRWQWPSKQGWIGLWLPYLLLLLIWWFSLSLVGRETSVRNFDGRGLVATLRLVPAMVQWMGVSMAFAAGCGAVVAWCNPTSQMRRWAVLSAVGIGSGLGLLVAASLVTDVYADYGMAFLPHVFVLGGMSVGCIADAGDRVYRRGLTALVLVIIVLGGVLPSTVSHLMDGTRFDYRPAFAMIRSSGPDLLVVTTPLIQRNEYAPDLRAAQLISDRVLLDSLLTGEQELWLIASVQRNGIMADGDGTIRDWLRQNCRITEHWERPRLDYRTYRVELHRCRSAPFVGTQTALVLPR